LVAVAPFHPARVVEQESDREVPRAELVLARAQVEHDAAAEVRSHYAVGRYRDDRLHAIRVRVEALLHVQVVHALDRLLLVRPGLDRPPAPDRLVERRQPLLAVEDELVRPPGLRQLDALHRPRLKSGGIPTGLHQHHHADGERLRDARHQRSDVLVVPDPRPLEVGQLDGPLMDLLEQLVEKWFLGVEGAADGWHGARSWSSPKLPGEGPGWPPRRRRARRHVAPTPARRAWQSAPS